MLTRKKPLARKPIKRRPKKPKPGSDPARLAFIRTLPCCVRTCSWPAEAHHPTGLRWGKGMGAKSADKYAIPLCHMHHRQFHDGSLRLVFEQLEAWQDYHVLRVMRIPTP